MPHVLFALALRRNCVNEMASRTNPFASVAGGCAGALEAIRACHRATRLNHRGRANCMVCHKHHLRDVRKRHDADARRACANVDVWMTRFTRWRIRAWQSYWPLAGPHRGRKRRRISPMAMLAMLPAIAQEVPKLPSADNYKACPARAIRNHPVREFAPWSARVHAGGPRPFRPEVNPRKNPE